MFALMFMHEFFFQFIHMNVRFTHLNWIVHVSVVTVKLEYFLPSEEESLKTSEYLVNGFRTVDLSTF